MEVKGGNGGKNREVKDERTGIEGGTKTNPTMIFPHYLRILPIKDCMIGILLLLVTSPCLLPCRCKSRNKGDLIIILITTITITITRQHPDAPPGPAAPHRPTNGRGGMGEGRQGECGHGGVHLLHVMKLAAGRKVRQHTATEPWCK